MPYEIYMRNYKLRWIELKYYAAVIEVVQNVYLWMGHNHTNDRES